MSDAMKSALFVTTSCRVAGRCEHEKPKGTRQGRCYHFSMGVIPWGGVILNITKCNGYVPNQNHRKLPEIMERKYFHFCSTKDKQHKGGIPFSRNSSSRAYPHNHVRLQPRITTRKTTQLRRCDFKC